jgi:hypothetical protein
MLTRHETLESKMGNINVGGTSRDCVMGRVAFGNNLNEDVTPTKAFMMIILP